MDNINEGNDNDIDDEKENDELIEQGLTSHQTHYRSYRGRFLQVI